MEDFRKYAKEMIRIRLSQILINEEYKAGRFKIPIHLAMGHEAIAVALDHVLKNGDKLILAHRNLAYNLARLSKLRPILDEFFLKPRGLARGKLGSMNLINPKRGIIYTSSILGNNFPVAVGVAMSAKISGRTSVAFVLGGDGSMEEGSFYENLVLAKTLGVRLVFVIENNEWSLGTHISERRCPIDIKKIAEAVGIPYSKLTGNNVYGYERKLARARSKAAGGPQVVEVAVRTLGDRRSDDGRFINYHAGPAPTIDVLKHSGAILKNSADDPIFVIGRKIGMRKIAQLSAKIMKELQDELEP